MRGFSVRRHGLLIDDEARQIPRAKIFDPLKHSYNPLAHLGYKEAREIAEVLYTVFSPQGENTLTVRNGKRALLRALLGANRLDKVRGDEEVTAMIDDILMSPVLKRVFCGKPNFTFSPRSMIVARINRAELGDFDALVLGLLLMASYKGQIIVPAARCFGPSRRSRSSPNCADLTVKMITVVGCRSYPPNAPFAELVCLSKSSVAEEYYAERSANRWVSE